MDDDFNSAGAIGVLFQLATLTNQKKSSVGANLLKELGNILGLLQTEKKEEVLDKEIEDLIHQRIAARKKKVKSEINGETIASTIISRVKEDVEALLSDNDLSTAIYYINKSIEPTLKSLQGQLSSSIQEVLDANNVNG